MRILVTGGAGYVGSFLVNELLRLGHIVTVVDRLMFGQPFNAHPNLRVYAGDVRVQQDLEHLLHGQEAVVHLAFASNDPAYQLDPRDAESINISPLKPLLRLAANAGVARFVFLSSCSVYGRTTNGCVNEDSSPVPLTDYARHKVACESIIREQTDRKLSWTILRPATAFGASARQRFDLLLNRMLAEAIMLGKIVIQGPAAVRPVVTLGCLADAILHVLTMDTALISQKTFNVASETKTVLGWAEFIQTHFPCDIIVPATFAQGDQRSYCVSMDRLKNTGFHSNKCVGLTLAELARGLTTNAYIDPLTAPVFHNIAVQREHDFSALKPMEQVL